MKKWERKEILVSESDGVLRGILYDTLLLYLGPTGPLLLVSNFFGSVPAFLLDIPELLRVSHPCCY